MFVQLASALGIAAAGKLAKPLVPGLLLMGAVGMTSFPAYVEGFKEIRNEPDMVVDSNGILRRLGIYCLIGGYAVLFYKRRGSIPFLPPTIRDKFTKSL